MCKYILTKYNVDKSNTLMYNNFIEKESFSQNRWPAFSSHHFYFLKLSYGNMWDIITKQSNILLLPKYC